jgi:hypothetical protein
MADVSWANSWDAKGMSAVITFSGPLSAVQNATARRRVLSGSGPCRGFDRSGARFGFALEQSGDGLTVSRLGTRRPARLFGRLMQGAGHPCWIAQA